MNYIQEALKRKIESDRQLAIYVDNSMAAVSEAAYDTTELVGLGFDRTVKHLSYFFSGYEDVNSNAWEENKRFFNSIDFFLKNRDPILEMIDIYIQKSVDKLDGAGLAEVMDMLYNSLKTPVAIASKYAVKTVTREVISAAISETIYITIMRNEVARKISKGASSSIFMMLGGYGIIEKASISKEQLKIQNPSYYWTLYFHEIEMLYFLIEPFISGHLYFIGNDKFTPFEVGKGFNEIISKAR